MQAEQQLPIEGQQQEQQLFDGDDEDQQNLMDDAEGDVASSDSQLQVKDPSQQIQNIPNQEQDIDNPLREYQIKEAYVLQWLNNNPGQKWVDKDFPPNSNQFYQDTANLPSWGFVPKNLQWKRPEQVIKDARFMNEDQKNKLQKERIQKGQKSSQKWLQIQIKHGMFGASEFVLGAALICGKIHLLQKLIVEKQGFDKGWVAFQFFKDGKWEQVIVDTLLPYEKQQNTKICLYSSCANPQQFWFQLMEKAYAKLHKNYQKAAKVPVNDVIVDLTGGLAESLELQSKTEKKQNFNIWNVLQSALQQKYMISAVNYIKGKSLKEGEQGQQGILENHHYPIVDMRQYPKDNLKLIRVRNPWGSEGVWTGPFCEEADDWQKYKAVKEDVKSAPKTRKADAAWWMSFTDFILQFDIVSIAKIFPQNWQAYSIQGIWTPKTNGGKCPSEKDNLKDTANHTAKQTHQKQLGHTKQFHGKEGHIQIQSDDRWFNNPQFRIKVNKDCKVWISLMLQDQQTSNQPYVSCGFMVASTKSRSQRFWERPPQNDILAEINYHSELTLQRQVTHLLHFKKTDKTPSYYIIVPNINDPKQGIKKQQGRKFFLRLFSADGLDVAELPQTIQLSVQGQWTENSAGGSRRIQVKQQGGGRKKGEIKQNPSWCKNPQYFLSIKQPTIVKIILRRGGTKKFKGWRIGMTVCRYEVATQRKTQKQQRRQKPNAGHNLQRLIQQTSQFLKPPVLGDVQRKLQVETHQKFKQSSYSSEQVSALLFRWNPTEGPFIIIPSSDGQQRIFNYRLTVYSNNPVQLNKLDDIKNQVMIGRWQKDITAGGCHLNQKQKQPSQRTWSMNPKYLLTFPEEQHVWQQPVQLKITLSIAEKHWKKINPNTVAGMIGIYLLQKRQGKITYSPDIVISQTSFLPVKSTTLQISISSPLKNGYIIMPSTYQSKVTGAFILAVKCDRPFELSHAK